MRALERHCVRGHATRRQEFRLCTGGKADTRRGRRARGTHFIFNTSDIGTYITKIDIRRRDELRLTKAAERRQQQQFTKFLTRNIWPTG